jgi:RimJ/RimL family protein N-acetyltransferase
MRKYSSEELGAALQIVSSAIGRCEKAQPKFEEGTSQHTLLKNRLKALYITRSLIIKESVINKYTKEELTEALRPISSIISKCQKAQQKHSEGTSNHTRFEKMIKAMNTSQSLIEDEISKKITDEFIIVSMSPEHAKEIAGWCYDGIYSFYNHNDNQIDGLLDGTHYACIDSCGNLIGYFCFGNDARIPTIEENVYDGDSVDVGIGLRPDMCGKGFGLTLINLGLNYARKELGYKKFRLSVATFNERAIKVYLKAGFRVDSEVTNSYFKNKFYIMTQIKV